MRSQGNQHLIPFNPEIETIAQRQSGVRRKQQEQIIMAKRDPRVLWGCVLPQAIDIASSTVSPVIEANNFEFRPALISFMEKDQFCGRPMENPISIFATF